MVDKRLFAMYFLAIGSAFIAESIILSVIGIELQTHTNVAGILASLDSWAADWSNFTLYILTAISTGLINPSILEQAGFHSQHIRLLMVGVGSLYLLVLIWGGFRLRSKNYLAPLALMLFSLLTIIAAMVIRMPEAQPAFSSYWPRYIPLRDIGIVGFGWVLVLELSSLRFMKTRYVLLAVAMPMMCLLFLNYSYLRFDHDRSRYVKALDNQEAGALEFIGNYLAENQAATFSEVSIKMTEAQPPMRMPNYFLRRNKPDMDVNTSPDMRAIFFLKKHSLNRFSN
jgi:hypothetical protein